MAAAAAAKLVLLLLLPYSAVASPSPYLFAATLFQDYQQMLTTFKIFIYPTESPISFPEPSASLFYDSLTKSPFITRDPSEAHLFFVRFPSNTTQRPLSRLIRDLRNNFPYWNRTLGADHFFVSPAGIDRPCDRNTLELKKNSVQISVFPVISGYFIPHKDVTLPPLNLPRRMPEESKMPAKTILGYLKWDGKTERNLVDELKRDDKFLVEEFESGGLGYLENFKRSRFCLFLYSGGEVWPMAEAMSVGCVPVVITCRAIQDLPFLDVLRWRDMAFLVGAGQVKRVLNGVNGERYAEMREMGVAASKHLMWNEGTEGEGIGVFNMVMYQLWRRRHVIRYCRRDFVV